MFPRMATNAGNVSSPVAVVEKSHEDVVVVVSGAENPVPACSKPPFSVVLSGQNVSNVPVQDENALPTRPLTAFFTPQVRIPAADVFRAFRESNVNSSDVSCLQRTSNGQVVITFRRAECKEQFLRRSVLKVAGTPYALQDVDRPLTYLQIFDAPHSYPILLSFNAFPAIAMSYTTVAASLPSLAGNTFTTESVITAFVSKVLFRVT